MVKRRGKRCSTRICMSAAQRGRRARFPAATRAWSARGSRDPRRGGRSARHGRQGGPSVPRCLPIGCSARGLSALAAPAPAVDDQSASASRRFAAAGGCDDQGQGHATSLPARRLRPGERRDRDRPGACEGHRVRLEAPADPSLGPHRLGHASTGGRAGAIPLAWW